MHDPLPRVGIFPLSSGVALEVIMYLFLGYVSPTFTWFGPSQQFIQTSYAALSRRS